MGPATSRRAPRHVAAVEWALVAMLRFHVGMIPTLLTRAALGLAWQSTLGS